MFVNVNYNLTRKLKTAHAQIYDRTRIMSKSMKSIMLADCNLKGEHRGFAEPRTSLVASRTRHRDVKRVDSCWRPKVVGSSFEGAPAALGRSQGALSRK